MSPRRLRVLLACTAFPFGVAAQEPHWPAPLTPQVDLDHKVAGPATPIPPAIAKVDVPALQGGAPSTRARASRGNDASVALPNGRGFRLGLPADAVVFDAAGNTIWAEGANYKASFAGAAFTFVPFLGSDAPRNYPLTFSLQALALGGAVPLAATRPARHGNAVSLDHGVVVERYDLHPDHVAQTFAIATPFRGDLTLTLAVATDLVAARAADGLTFGNALGHVGYTDAVLVDARGRRMAMTTEYADGRITLRADAATLAAAAFPITVDPVITTFAVTSGYQVLMKPDIAFCDSAAYLVAWVRVFSAADLDVHAMAIDPLGNPVTGSSSLIDNTSDRWDDCRAAMCPPNFLVVASRVPAGGGESAIWGRTRAIASASMGPQTQINGAESGDKVTPDVGGDIANPRNFCVVWQRNYSPTDHDIHYRMVSAAGTPVGHTEAIANAGTDDDYTPRIAKCNGLTFVWPVTWQRRIGAQHDIWGARVLWDGTHTANFAIDTTLDDDTQPAPTSPSDRVGGVGGPSYFLVAYTTNNGGNLDIFLRAFRDDASPVQISSGFLATLEGLSLTERARPQYGAQVDCDGGRFAIAYMDRLNSVNRDAYVSVVDLAPSLRIIDARTQLTGSARDTSEVCLVANRSGGGLSLISNDYGTAWNMLASGIFANSVDGAIYRGITRGGGLSVRATGCGDLSLSFPAGQIPTPGATLRFDLTYNGPTLFVIGTPIAAVPLCPPAACALGATPSVALAQQTLQLWIPREPGLVGATFAVQGAAVGSPFGCTGIGGLVTSITVDVTVR